MVVGEAPGAHEKQQGRPFIGPSGRILRSALMHLGINEKHVYFTNLCKYQPPGNDLSAWLPKCKPNPNSPILEGMLELNAEIEEINPNIIVALGNYPLWMLTGLTRMSKEGPTGIGDWRGSIVQGNEFAGGRKVLASYHPAAVLRQYNIMPLFRNDLGKLVKESVSPEIVRRPRNIIMNPVGEERARLMRRYLDSPGTMAFDIEYTPGTGDLICCSFSIHPEEAFSIATQSGEDYHFVREMLTTGKPLVAQNGIFDCSILEYWYDIPCLTHLKHDTMLAQHSAYVELPKDLGTLCTLNTDQPCYWTALEDKHWRQPRTESWLATTMKYNAIDAYVTKEVEEVQLVEELTDPAVRKTFDFAMSLHDPLWAMSRAGVLVDRAGMERYKVELSLKEQEHMHVLTALAGKEINVKSGPQIAKLLYTDRGIKPTAFTKGGKPQSDDKALVDIARHVSGEDRQIVDAIRSIRDCRDLKSKFLDIKLDPDARLRCHYNIGGTTTGRLASRKFFPTGSGGNLQNIPRDPRVRRVFVAEKGKTFFYNDLKSAESHVVAQLTGDPLMLKLHEPGGKPHEVTAAYLFGMDPKDVGKDSIERYLGKRTRHAGNYMMNWKRFMDQINADSLETGVFITAAQAKKLIAGYRAMHPRLAEWWKSIERSLMDSNVLSNLHGRPRIFFGRPLEILPNAVAFKPQSTIGDHVNIALHRIYHDPECKFYKVECLLQVHDAIGGQAPTEVIEPAMKRVRELMTIPLWSDMTQEHFTIPVDVGIGPNWADVETLAG